MRWEGISTQFYNPDKPFDSIQNLYDFCNIIEAWIEYEEDENTEGELYTKLINSFLQRESYDHKIVNGQMVPYSEKLSYQGLEKSFIIHLRNPQFSPVRDILLEAISEFSDGKYADALTDGGRAVQKYLTIKGFEDKNASRQVDLAKQHGFILPKDVGLWTWLLSTRNGFGDAHPAASPTQAQTWSYLEILGSVFERYESKNENS